MNIGVDVDGVLVDMEGYQLRTGTEYFKKKYGKDYPRLTEITSFETIAVTKVVNNNAKLYANMAEGFVGMSLKREDGVELVGDCSDLSEIIVIEDGPVSPALHEAILACGESCPQTLRCAPRPEHCGLAAAMHWGVLQCRNEWIARMDADDYSDPARCADELALALRENVDIVGCDCEEFIGSVDHPVSRRLFPADHDAIVAFSRRRTPFCHPAVMMKKSAVLRAGNYRDRGRNRGSARE